jgi:hypothetical protein
MKKDKLRESKLKHLFSIKIYKCIVSIELDKVNHKIPETLMLSQRIGAFKYENYVIEDGTPRILYDKFTEFEDGSSYKG